jgi:hypothetical protein
VPRRDATSFDSGDGKFSKHFWPTPSFFSEMRKLKREIYLCISTVKVWKPQVSAYEEEDLEGIPSY